MHDSYTFKSDNVASTDNYADVPISSPSGVSQSGRDLRLLTGSSGPISLNWKNAHGANGITVQVLGSNDAALADADWDVVVAGTAIAAGASLHVKINPAYYQFYRFQHKATVGGSQGTSAIRGCQKLI